MASFSERPVSEMFTDKVEQSLFSVTKSIIERTLVGKNIKNIFLSVYHGKQQSNPLRLEIKERSSLYHRRQIVPIPFKTVSVLCKFKISRHEIFSQ